MGNLEWIHRCGLATGVAGAIFSGEIARGAPQAPFTEEAIQRGIFYPVVYGDAFGCGVGFVDLDGDLDPDIVTTGADGGVVGIYENDGTGQFASHQSTSGLPAILKASGVCAADYDGDGDLDLYFTVWNGPNVLARNDGGFQFTDVAVAAGLADPGSGAGCTWGDYDGDGDLDLYLSNRTDSSGSIEPNKLFENQGDGTFLDVTVNQVFSDLDAPTFQAIFLDYDRDDDVDLYLSNDKGYGFWHNYLYRNDAGSFFDATTETGTNAGINSMGVAIGDFDGNGWEDIYITNTPEGNELYLNDQGIFTESSVISGTTSNLLGWGALFVDYDNDGWRELYVCNQDGPNRLYDHDGTWPCSDVANTALVADPGMSFSVAAADLEGDGDIDFLVQNFLGLVRLYVNHEGETRGWARFRFAGVGDNLHGIGGRVTIGTASSVQTASIVSGIGYKGQCELVAHFGVDADVRLETVEARWPGGGAVRNLSNYDADATWTLYSPARLGDFEGDGFVGPTDFVHFWRGYTGPGLGLVRPGWEMMDFDGDSDVDATDYSAFLALWSPDTDRFQEFAGSLRLGRD